jgi:hypothetical protein
MKLQNTNGIFLSALATCITVTFTVTTWAEPAVTNLQQRGKLALKKETLSAEIERFSEVAVIEQDPKARARLDFRQAVALQKLAADPEQANPQEHLKRAAGLYQGYLKTNPQSAAAANNLARVYEQLGFEIAKDSDPSRARRYYAMAAENYAKAVNAGDARQGLYLKNYAEFNTRIRNWKKARELYARLVADHPLSPALQQSLFNTFYKHNLETVGEFLWHLLDAGYIHQTTAFALQALQQSFGLESGARSDLLTILCASLAERTDDYAGFLDLELRKSSSPLIKDGFLGEGVREIVRLLKAQDFERDNYGWWRSHDFNIEDPPIGMWPMDGFRALARSLGSRSKRSGNLELAEAYFRLAADMEPWNIDPMAVRAMVQMYAEKNQFQKIDAALDQYQVQLFESKGSAYRASSAGKIFLYHQTLGELYALIERWGNSRKVDSAIFQLEHARDFSMRLAARSTEKLPEKYQFTPPMVEVLATGYVKTGQPVEATKLRIDQAEYYQQANDPKAAVRVLAPVREADLSSADKIRFESLKAIPDLNLQLQKLNVEGAVIKDSEG